MTVFMPIPAIAGYAAYSPDSMAGRACQKRAHFSPPRLSMSNRGSAIAHAIDPHEFRTPAHP